MSSPDTADDAIPAALRPPFPDAHVRRVYDHCHPRRDAPSTPTTEDWLRTLAAVGDEVALEVDAPGDYGPTYCVCYERQYFLVGDAPEEIAGRLSPASARVWLDELGVVAVVPVDAVGFDPDAWPAVARRREREQFIRDIFDGQ